MLVVCSPRPGRRDYRQVVNRRWFGVLVVVGVLLAAVLGPDPSTRRVAGNPTPVSVSKPPSIGLCVTTLTMADRRADLEEVTDFPTAVYGPCDGSTVGEISSVDQAAAPARQVTGADYWPLTSQCALDAIGYTGSIPPVVKQGAGRPGILWRPSLTFVYTPIGPDAAQRALGQHWSACVINSPTAHPYDGRLRGSLSNGVLPPAFGSCWPSNDVQSTRQIPCDEPHSVELLGTTILDTSPIPADDVRAACAVFAGRVMRTTDPNRQGVQLDILDFMAPSANFPAGNSVLRDQYVSCYAMAPPGSRFGGTLVGNGERPLPLVR